MSFSETRNWSLAPLNLDRLNRFVCNFRKVFALLMSIIKIWKILNNLLFISSILINVSKRYKTIFLSFIFIKWACTHLKREKVEWLIRHIKILNMDILGIKKYVWILIIKKLYFKVILPPSNSIINLSPSFHVFLERCCFYTSIFKYIETFSSKQTAEKTCTRK